MLWLSFIMHITEKNTMIYAFCLAQWHTWMLVYSTALPVKVDNECNNFIIITAWMVIIKERLLQVLTHSLTLVKYGGITFLSRYLGMELNQEMGTSFPRALVQNLHRQTSMKLEFSFFVFNTDNCNATFSLLYIYTDIKRKKNVCSVWCNVHCFF